MTPEQQAEALEILEDFAYVLDICKEKQKNPIVATALKERIEDFIDDVRLGDPFK